MNTQAANEQDRLNVSQLATGSKYSSVIEYDGSDDEFEATSSEIERPGGKSEARDQGHNPPANKMVGALLKAVEDCSSHTLTNPLLTVPASTPSPPHAPGTIGGRITSDHTPGDVEARADSDTEAVPRMVPRMVERPLYKPTEKWAPFANEPIKNPVVIATLNSGAMCDAYIKRGTLGGRNITYISKTWRKDRNWHGFFAEMTLYASPDYLLSLQGVVIPTIIGIYLVEGAISVAMELPSSSFWVEATDDMSNHLKRKCIAAFDAIHKCGVLHNDIELRHMLIGADGKVSIIDFQASRVKKPLKDVGLLEAKDDQFRLEDRLIRFRLNYEDARRREYVKHNRAFAKADRLYRQSLSREMSANSSRDDEEPEDPDDIINPPVHRDDWIDVWTGEAFTSACYVVPGQDKNKVNEELGVFMMDEMDRQDRDKPLLKNTEETKMEEAKSGCGSSNDNPPQTSTSIDQPAVQADENTNKLSSCLVSSTTTPSRSPGSSLLASSKRKSCDSGEIDEDDGKSDSEQPPPAKRRQLVKEQLNITSIQALPASSSLAAPVLKRKSCDSGDTNEDNEKSDFSDSDSEQPPLKRRQLTEEQSSTTTIETPTVPVHPELHPLLPLYPVRIPEEKLVDSIEVPYSGYTGPGGFTIPNNYQDKEIAYLRRVWITQSNLYRCREEGLSYPLAHRLQLTPATDTSPKSRSERRKEGKKRYGLGALRRAKIEREQPGERRRLAIIARDRYLRRKDQIVKFGHAIEADEKVDDGIPEGPKILSPSELKQHHAKHKDVYGPKSTAPRPRGILARQLTEDQKNARKRYEEVLLNTYLLARAITSREGAKAPDADCIDMSTQGPSYPNEAEPGPSKRPIVLTDSTTSLRQTLHKAEVYKGEDKDLQTGITSPASILQTTASNVLAKIRSWRHPFGTGNVTKSASGPMVPDSKNSAEKEDKQEQGSRHARRKSARLSRLRSASADAEAIGKREVIVIDDD